MVRGYEVAKGEFVDVADEELDQLPLRTTHTIEIAEFCADSDIESGVYVKGAYYLEPEKVGEKPYALLRNALGKTGKVAIGKVALRDREHLCRLSLHGKGLLLNTLHWPDEIRDMGGLSLPEDETAIHKRELAMAVMLIENLSTSFDPERYQDDYRQAVKELVEAKLTHNPVIRTAAPAPQVTDLMAALKASVEESERKRASTSSEEAPPVRRRRAS